MTDARFNSYMGAPLSLVPLDIMADTLTEVVCWLSGGSGSGGTDAVSLQHWLVQYGKVSAELRNIVTSFMERLANSHPLWV